MTFSQSDTLIRHARANILNRQPYSSSPSSLALLALSFLAFQWHGGIILALPYSVIIPSNAPAWRYCPSVKKMSERTPVVGDCTSIVPSFVFNLDQRIASCHGLAGSFEPPADVRLHFRISNLGRRISVSTKGLPNHLLPSCSVARRAAHGAKSHEVRRDTLNPSFPGNKPVNQRSRALAPVPPFQPLNMVFSSCWIALSSLQTSRVAATKTNAIRTQI